MGIDRYYEMEDESRKRYQAKIERLERELAEARGAAMSEPNPEIPGLGEDPESKWTPAPPEAYAPEAAPGAILWKPFPLPGTVPAGGARVRMVSGQYSVVGPYDGYPVGAGALRAEIEDRGIVPTPIPPALPKIDDVTLNATTVVAGGEVMGEVDLTLPAPAGGTQVNLSSSSPWVTVPPYIVVPQGQLSAPFKALTSATITATTSVTITALANLSSDNATFAVQPKPPEPIPIPPIPIPPQPTPGPLPISRTIDLTGKTQGQIQAAINTAQPGDGLFLGPGVYNLSANMGGEGQGLDVLHRQGITIFGAGPSTVLNCAGKEGVWFRMGGNVNQGNCIRDLAIQSCRRAVCALDPQRLWIQGVTITGCTHGYASERTAAFDNAMHEWPVILERVSVNGWASHGMMLHGGETLRRCQLIDTPGGGGSTYSHGLYMQGCKNLTVEDLLIENTSGHSYQIYSDGATHAANGADNVVMRRITCNRCYYGPIWAANGKYTNLVLEDLTVTGTISRNSGTFVISATNDVILSARMRNIVIDGGGEALVLQGGQPGAIQDLQIDGLVVRNHQVGIRIAPSGWPYTKIVGSAIRNYSAPGVPVPVAGTSPGLTIS